MGCTEVVSTEVDCTEVDYTVGDCTVEDSAVALDMDVSIINYIPSKYV